jgi:hypothetical protein
MNEERRKILDMLAEGKISTDEAEKLLAAISSEESGEKKSQPESSSEKQSLKYLRVVVEPAPDNKDGEKVNIRVPMKLMRAGIKLASLVPVDVQGKVQDALKEKGVKLDLSQITEDNLEELIEALSDLTVDVEGKEKVRIFCE